MAISKGVSIITLGLVILCVGAQCSIAEEVPNFDEIINEISNIISEEFVTCSAYYSIASEGIRRAGHLKSAEKSEKISDTALKYALISAKKGRTQEMAEKVTLARLELNMKLMTNEIDNEFTNISILINKYSYRCKEIMENPDKMMDELRQNGHER
jgi:hypothetical protein